MKKIMAIVLLLCMCIGLCACGSSAGQSTAGGQGAVMKELEIGTWTRNFNALGLSCSESFNFKNQGEYTSTLLMAGSVTADYGTYVISDTTITITNKSGEVRSIHYTFESGYLNLTMIGDAGEWQLTHDK